MRSRHLLLALRDFLKESLKDCALPDPETGTDAAPRVFLHNLPDARTGDVAYPFVIARLGTYDCDEERCEDTVSLAVGVWSPQSQEQAGLLTAHTLDVLRAALMRRRLLAQTFDLVLPLEGSQPEPRKQWNEYHLATLITRWNYAVPRRPLADEEGKTGGGKPFL